MKAQAPGTMQRASRTRIAVAMCIAGLVAGTLSSSLVGAGADDPPAVPGEAVAAPPTQIAPTATTEIPAAAAIDPAGADGAAPADAAAASEPVTAPETPAVSEPATPDPAATAPAVPSAPPAAAPAAAAPAAPVATPAPAAAPARQPAPATTPAPANDPQPLGGLAGEPQTPAARTCIRTRPVRRAGRSRLVAGAKISSTAKPTARIRAAVACKQAPAARNTPGRVKTGSSDSQRDSAGAKALRNDQGVPTLSNPSTSLAIPGPAPIGVPNFFIDKFRIPVFLLPIYQAAGIQYGVRWEVLAAINEIETDYGRNLNVSSAGALGWMQFMPATWKGYGVDANRDGRKDPFNPVDAIFAAARYLKAAGAADDLRGAIFAYNHADWYVESVLMRARLIGGMPSDLVGSLSGLTQGHFPVFAKARYADDISERSATRRGKLGTNVAMPVESDATRRGIDIYAAAGSPVIAVQDGRIVSTGTSRRLGRYVKMRDVYGNTYTYSRLKSVAAKIPVPKDRTQSKASIAKELALPKADPRPTRAASAGRQTSKRPSLGPPTPQPSAKKAATIQKERLFAHPARPNALPNGGARQLLDLGSTLAEGDSLKSYFTGAFGLNKNDVVLRPLVAGSRVIAGTVLGRLGTTSERVAPHVHFEIRPAGRGAPLIDPKPILDGWKLLEATAIYRAKGRNPLAGASAFTASIGQIMLMSKEALQQRVLSNPRIEIYSCGRRDIEAGGIDRRVLATLEFLAASGLKPTVTSLHCGHGYYTASGNVSEHSAGAAVDIAMVNGIPILGHQGEGSITDITIRRLLTLQGTMKPHQIISLMTYKDADNTLALSDHDDHIHVGFHPEYAAGTPAAKELEAVLKPSQWIKLIDRLGEIHNPSVAKTPSKYAITVPVPRASEAHTGE
jgi:hypothetical protein